MRPCPQRGWTHLFHFARCTGARPGTGRATATQACLDICQNWIPYVASLFTEMEDRLDIIIEDDDVDGDVETYGGLPTFAEAKRPPFNGRRKPSNRSYTSCPSGS
jgi:hypothetical protein